jgi:beta-lactam-binding protein with PASTA domain
MQQLLADCILLYDRVYPPQKQFPKLYGLTYSELERWLKEYIIFVHWIKYYLPEIIDFFRR